MRALNEEETKSVVEKLMKFIGDNVRKLLERTDKAHLFRLHHDRVYYVEESVMKRSLNIPRKKLQSFGTCIGKFTHTGKFKLLITALPILAAYAEHKMWVKPSAEQSFLYGNNVTKAGLGRITENTPNYAGVVVYSMSDTPLGFGVAAKSTAECRRAQPMNNVLLHQADVGEFIRSESDLLSCRLEGEQFSVVEMAEGDVQKSPDLKKAFVVGWTGATGELLVKELANRSELIPEGVVLLGRRNVEFPADDPRSKFKQEVVDFDNLSGSKAAVEGCQVGYCCLGTTHRESGKAGARKVEYDYCMASGRLAKEVGCTQFHYVSSTGANKNSMTPYAKTKGEVEAELTDLQFSKLMIYRPALLLRGDKARGGEKFFGALIKPITYFKPNFGQCEAGDIAKAMLYRTKNPADKDVEIVPNGEIHKFSAQL